MMVRNKNECAEDGAVHVDCGANFGTAHNIQKIQTGLVSPTK